MPTYAYACTACEHRFEIVQAFSENSLSECPQCQGRLRKLFNAVGVVFKGSGFYRTDSRNDSRRGAGNKAHAGSTTTGTTAPSRESASTSDSSGSTSESSSGAASTKTAIKSPAKTEGSAA